MRLNVLHQDPNGLPRHRENIKTESGYFAEFPEELKEIPREYFSSAKEQGNLEELYYNTYESMTYAEKTQELKKRAIIYLPHNYSEENKYNVFYLMHGGWSNETTIMGTDRNPRSFKHVIDHAIEDGKIQPLIKGHGFASSGIAACIHPAPVNVILFQKIFCQCYRLICGGLLLLLTLMLCFSVTACTSKGGQTEMQSSAQNDAGNNRLPATRQSPTRSDNR